MNPHHTLARRLATLLVSATLCIPASAFSAEAAGLPPGISEFTGRLSHQYWHLLGPDKRSELDRLNRGIREVERTLQEHPDPAARATALERAEVLSQHLLELLRNCPDRLQLELTSERPHLDRPSPLNLPGETGALLLEIHTQGEGVHFASSVTDLAEPQGESSRITVDVAAQGTTCALLGIDHLPVGRTTLLLEVRRPGHNPLRLPLDVSTPQPGQLRLTVLSDDTGKPAPAMVRLMWRTDGLQRRPSNGIEFAPQFDRQGHATGARAANLPGPLNSHFWCVPGPFDMALAPGVWQIGVRRGIEHEALFEDVTITSGQTTVKTLRPRRWVDQRQSGWWSGDDHVHCRILSDDDARHLMAWVQAEDIHLANVVKMGDIYRTYFEQRGFGPDHRIIDGDTVLVPGQECPRTHDQIGHTLAMNITNLVRNTDRYYLYDEVFDAVHAQGGLSGYAHINSGLFHVHRDMSLNLPRGKVDFGEILQFNHLGTELYYQFLNLGCKLTASAGSDVPWGGTIGEARVYAWLGNEPFSADAWFRAFQRGRTFTTSGPMIEFTVDNAYPGDEILLEQSRPLRVRARATSEPSHTAPLQLEIVRHGEIVQSAQSANGSPPDVSLDFTLNSDHGFWIAARARAGDGTTAHTTPVYVIRQGLRFWKFAEVTPLLAHRAESLRQIEEIVTEAKRLHAEGRLESDRYRQQLAIQGDALLEKVQLARQIYQDLALTAQKETAARQ